MRSLPFVVLVLCSLLVGSVGLSAHAATTANPDPSDWAFLLGTRGLPSEVLVCGGHYSSSVISRSNTRSNMTPNSG